ncbi:hypothetical protein [Arenibacterium halophilum]|jgi:hypothetical protein|uniref:Uncharacterized protein n=1 Tax=Arenibacterium halophilum TaxID=2583821 RepID=A0ABY2X267_9RHOB|nr:hypothetical protein [Arenibacterium halophilum]MAY88302.1 hypothetical protein [Pseudooceanicola sp.]TMV09374.1 hypothetical protein FGK64_20030 [Arenibacterium halophilum]
MKEFSPGDLVEVDTGVGLAYVLVTHDHPSYPTVVRVLSGRHDSRPTDLTALAKGPAHQTVMIPLAGALKRLGVAHEVAATIDISDIAHRFPTFRMPIRDKQGNIVYWWFWDGQGLSYEVDPSEEQNALPLREVTSAERLLALLRQDTE